MPARVAALLDERKKLERELADAKQEARHGRRRRRAASAAAAACAAIGGVKLMARAVERRRRQGPEGLADEGKKQLGSGVVAIVGVSEDGKASVVVAVTADLIGALQRRRSGAHGVRGAGRPGRRRPPDMAQAGGPDGAKADEALAAVEAALGRNRPAARATAHSVFERSLSPARGLGRRKNGPGACVLIRSGRVML